MSKVTTFSDYAARWREILAGGGAGISERDFNNLALSLFTLQFEHNAILRRLSEARRVSPRTLADWRQIPAVPTSAFKECEVTSLPPGERTTVYTAPFMGRVTQACRSDRAATQPRAALQYRADDPDRGSPTCGDGRQRARPDALGACARMVKKPNSLQDEALMIPASGFYEWTGKAGDNAALFFGAYEAGNADEDCR